ncbi:MAG: NTP transferase domain-containing protein [Planctomycetota bacterium]
MPRPHAYILAGGAGRRFGGDKAAVDRGGLSGVTWLSRRLRTLGCEGVTAVAADAGAYDGQDVPTIADDVPGLGPASGLETALRHAAERNAEQAVLVVTVDTFSLPDSLVDALTRAMTDGVDYVRIARDGFHPFPALVRPGVRRLIARLRPADGGGLSMRRLLDEAGDTVATVALPAGETLPESFNTRAEYDALRDRFGDDS